MDTFGKLRQEVDFDENYEDIRENDKDRRVNDDNSEDIGEFDNK
jgi:hypothetical protein